MTQEAMLQELEAIAAELSVKVSYEALAASVGTGGLCRVHGEYRVIIDRRAQTGERLAALAQALGTLSSTMPTLSATLAAGGATDGAAAPTLELSAPTRDLLRHYALRRAS